jgi:hypothetical protein
MSQDFLLQRRIPVEENFDLVVVGGGPAGCGAAISAARLGAKVLLIEGTGCLGGMGTAGLVAAWSDLADGERMIVGGLFGEIVETMYARGFFKPGIDTNVWRRRLHAGFAYSPEGLKLLLDELCAEAGVEVRFFTRLIDADMSGGKLRGIVVNNIEGHTCLRAPAFVDATGDAILAKLCGFPYQEAFRDTPTAMPPTLCALQASMDLDVFDKSLEQDTVHQGIADKFFSQPDRHVPGLFPWGASTAMMNAGHIFGTNALKCRSLSDAMVKGRQLAWEYTSFYRKYMKGCENMELLTTASLLGVRESRRIEGEYEVGFEDYVQRRNFPDQIACYNKSIDIHVHDLSNAEWERYLAEFVTCKHTEAGEYYGLPYGILVPLNSENLWVAGRCNSSDTKVHGSIRDQPACFMMGQAAGTAAVQAIRTGQTACTLDTATLVETLREAGAHLPQKTLSKEMTRKSPKPAAAATPQALEAVA